MSLNTRDGVDLSTDPVLSARVSTAGSFRALKIHPACVRTAHDGRTAVSRRSTASFKGRLAFVTGRGALARAR